MQQNLKKGNINQPKMQQKKNSKFNTDNRQKLVENIFMDIDGHIRIGDLGLCKPDMDKNIFAHSFCGSPEYMAPEMLLKVGHTYNVDHYCIGALLYELITGLPPFYSHNTEEIYESIL